MKNKHKYVVFCPKCSRTLCSCFNSAEIEMKCSRCKSEVRILTAADGSGLTIAYKS